MTAIVGRSAELATLRAAVGSVRGGRTGVVVLAGEAGIGKTTLLDAVAELAAGAGFAVGRGAAAELESDRPFGPLAAALELDVRSADPRRRAIASLVSGRTESSSAGLAATVPEARYRAVDAICGLVDALSTERPIALLLEDLHWSDEPTLLALRRLMRLTGVPLLLVMTTRPPEPLGPVAATLDAAPGATRLDLGPLARAEVVTLVKDLVGGPPGPRLLALADGAGGNPLFVAELVAVLRQDGSLRAEEDGVDVADGAGTADLARRLRARAARLTPAAGALVRVAAVLGSSFTLDEAGRTGGWAVADLVEPLNELLRAGLLHDTGATLSFRHDLLRRAIEDELPPTARRALHTAAGHALAATGASAARIARHLALGAMAGDREAVRWLHRAAQEIAQRGPATAVTLLDDALALVDRDDPFRLQLLSDRVEALGWSGRNAEAETLARELLDKVEDRDVRVALRRQLALALFIANRPGDAADECDRSVAETRDDPASHALALAEGALACIAGAQIARAESLVDEVLDIGRGAGADDAVSLALSVRSRLLSFRGRFRDSLATALEAMIEPAGSTAHRPRHQPGLFAIFSMNDLDRLDEMATLLRAERAAAEEQGIVWAIPLYHAAAANRHLFLGELADATAEATAGLTVAEDSGAVLPVAWMHAVLALVNVHRGELAGADAHLAAARHAMASTTPLLGTDLYALAEARLVEARRDIGGAAQSLIGAWDLFEAIGVTGGQRNIGFDAVRLALLHGDVAAAERIVPRLQAIADDTGAPADIATALYALAALAGDADGLVKAVATFEPGVQPLRQAHMAEEAATMLWAAGRGDEATTELDRARRLWAESGATLDARRALERFAALGLRRPRSTARPTSGWSSLTPTEHRVAELVATGAANAAIAGELGISRRTVETHLGHVYAKLRVTSRVQLALEASRRAEEG